MKFSTKHLLTNKTAWFVTCLSIFVLLAGCKKFDQPPTVTITTVASGLANPMGIDADNYGNLWVSEGETINNDGRVMFVKPNGQKFPAIVNLSAFSNKQSGQPQGTSHLLLDGHYLFVLSGDYLYRVDISKFRPGVSSPIDASKLAHEDIGAFSYAQGFPDSHAYNLTKGPDGDLYIADAGANAIIHRHGWNKYSILAKFDNFTNPNPPSPSEPPFIQAVPTSIWWDGHDFLVTTLSGFPFIKGLAVIYKVSLSGNVSIYQKGFTELVDLAQGQQGHHIAVQHSTFGAMGFNHNTGALYWVNGSSSVQFAGGLDMPVGIKQVNYQTWFLTCMGDGTVKKITYK
jgi:hypothetical protein